MLEPHGLLSTYYVPGTVLVYFTSLSLQKRNLPVRVALETI